MANLHHLIAQTTGQQNSAGSWILALLVLVVWIYLLWLGTKWIKGGKRKVWGWILVLAMLAPVLASLAVAVVRVVALRN